MKNSQQNKTLKQQRRKHRVATTIKKFSNRMRLSVRKSLRHIYVQIIDDRLGRTLASASDLDATIQSKNLKNKTEIGFAVGELLGDKCSSLKIKEVVFDRGFSKYHGRVKALADGVRSKGLDF